MNTAFAPVYLVYCGLLSELEESIVPSGRYSRKQRGALTYLRRPEVWKPVLPAIVVEVRYDRFTGVTSGTELRVSLR